MNRIRRNSVDIPSPGLFEEPLHVGHLAAHERRGRRAAKWRRGMAEVREDGVHGLLGRLPGRRVAHAEDRHETREPVPGVVHDAAVPDQPNV